MADLSEFWDKQITGFCPKYAALLLEELEKMMKNGQVFESEADFVNSGERSITSLAYMIIQNLVRQILGDKELDIARIVMLGDDGSSAYHATNHCEKTHRSRLVQTVCSGFFLFSILLTPIDIASR